MCRFLLLALLGLRRVGPVMPPAGNALLNLVPKERSGRGYLWADVDANLLGEDIPFLQLDERERYFSRLFGKKHSGGS